MDLRASARWSRFVFGPLDYTENLRITGTGTWLRIRRQDYAKSCCGTWWETPVQYGDNFIHNSGLPFFLVSRRQTYCLGDERYRGAAAWRRKEGRSFVPQERWDQLWFPSTRLFPRWWLRTRYWHVFRLHLNIGTQYVSSSIIYKRERYAQRFIWSVAKIFGKANSDDIPLPLDWDKCLGIDVRRGDRAESRRDCLSHPPPLSLAVCKNMLSIYRCLRSRWP